RAMVPSRPTFTASSTSLSTTALDGLSSCVNMVYTPYRFFSGGRRLTTIAAGPGAVLTSSRAPSVGAPVRRHPPRVVVQLQEHEAHVVGRLQQRVPLAPAHGGVAPPALSRRRPYRPQRHRPQPRALPIRHADRLPLCVSDTRKPLPQPLRA